jgi:hypothetical protein
VWELGAGVLTNSGEQPLINTIKTALRDSSAPPGISELYSPPNQTMGIPDSVLLSWFPADNADSYRVQLSHDSLFSSFILDSIVATATSVSIKNLPGSQDFYWRVSAINDLGTGNFTGPGMFSTADTVLNSPVLISPPDSEADVAVDEVLTWTAVTGAGNYNLQVADLPDNCNLVIDTVIVNDTIFTAGGLEHSTTYYWRVNSIPGPGYNYAPGNFSNWSSFTTIASPPTLPVLSSPAENAGMISTRPVLRWKKAAFTDYYEVRLSLDKEFTQTIIDTQRVTATSISIRDLLPETKYYWSVKAISNVGESYWTEARKFTTGKQDGLAQMDGESDSFEIYQNYPNPFNAATIIRFGLPVRSDVRILISDIQGKSKVINTFRQLEPGIYEIPFEGLYFSSGVYFYTIIAIVADGSAKQKVFEGTKKMLVIK